RAHLAHALWPVMLAVGVLNSSASAQDQDVGKRALDEARAELAAEKVRIEAERTEQAARMDLLVAERKSLADQFIDLELEIAEKEAAFTAIRAIRVELRAEVEALRQGRGELPKMLRDASVKVADLLDVLPPSGAELSEESLGTESVDEFVSTMDALLAASRGTNTYRETLRLQDGWDVEADVLRIGLMAWYYRATNGGRVGVAMNAPGSDEAYRWNEDLSVDARDAISTAVDLATAGKGGVAGLPLDVTVQMEAESMTREKTMMGTIKAGGPVIIPLAGVALLAALMILERVLMLSRTGLFTSVAAERILEHTREGRFAEALAACEERTIPVTRALRAGLKQRENGAEAMEDAVQAAVLNELPRLERFLPTIAMLASIAPLLGLLGTVTGMIVTFEMIATLGSGNPRIMAGGISQALITTAAGLVVAIPILLSHSFLASRVDRLVADMERFGAVLLNSIQERRST
ncbi:MAG: MotA/TolQ/ExbB proton channel family protein, partial [bacterium]